ncbi:MAG: hypothetical protein COV44_01360 [Deltaproteobacteria bacterium CG11_big_fil_rev_8_21_14_0_20_45_16]|nr:MAG: hypothetical protein COV44_01360 [Deltaproteobacteria bacterium CG11_big_fil_rev_8_21_14_0_20_45_16]
MDLLSLVKPGFAASPLLLESEQSPVLIEKMAKKIFDRTEDSKSFAHPDWIQLDGDKLKLENLRESLIELRRRPFEKSFRLLTIENFEACNIQIQNALLKTLEEPLAHWIILLGVISSHGILSTIRSRCLVYHEPRQANTLSELSNLSFIFEAIHERDELRIHELTDAYLKNRDETRKLLVALLTKASQLGYPGHWSEFAPQLLESLKFLDRNINPRSLWDQAWTRSMAP